MELFRSYLTYGIFMQRGDVVAYLGNKEFDVTADIILNMCESKNDYYLFISTENADKESYITGAQFFVCNRWKY